MSIKITSDLLMRAGACKEQRVLFADTFPEGAEMNEANLQVALEARLNLNWFVMNFFRLRWDEYSAEIAVITAAKHLRRVKLDMALREEKMKWPSYRLAWNEVMDEEKREICAIAKDFILRHWKEDYGDDKRAYWFSAPSDVVTWAMRTKIG